MPQNDASCATYSDASGASTIAGKDALRRIDHEHRPQFQAMNCVIQLKTLGGSFDLGSFNSMCLLL